ncbi:MAG TPA: putative protein N(5)-glutamine methyltransferase [Nocardioidaceae bacterium]|nr:putative protein N(5)-glutamine methyltransferase [Nocardioidaceae bacterium]
MPSYADVVGQLRAAGSVFAEDEAILLIDAAKDDLEELVARRVAGAPLEQVVGWAQFAGLRIPVDPGVFVPRRRTELLARRAAALVPPDGVAVDLCCGSGAIAALIRAVNPSVELHAADLDEAAVRCATRNLGESVHQGDLYDALPRALRGGIDVLVANAPYVPTSEISLMPAEARDFEPRVTLDGGDDGLDVIRRVVTGATEWLSDLGHLLFEVGRPQVAVAEGLCRDAGLIPMVVQEDGLSATAVIAKRG